MSNVTTSNNPLLAMLKQYEDNSTSAAKNTQSKKYDLKNYFTTYIPDTIKTATKRIRILPTSDGSSPFVEIHGHKFDVEGEKKTFACLKHMKGLACPFCEATDELRSIGGEANKELAKKYSAKRMYVVKVVDRDKEDEGVKFWRFNHDYRNQGILDKIFGVLKAVNKDITDPQSGRDLLIVIGRDQKNIPTVQSINQVDASPLSEDTDLANAWLSDDRTWEDVYSVKPYEYLEILIKGGSPMWDKDAKKFVDKLSNTDKISYDTDGEITLGVPNVKPNLTVSTSVPTTEPVVESDDSDDDDLPF